MRRPFHGQSRTPPSSLVGPGEVDGSEPSDRGRDVHGRKVSSGPPWWEVGWSRVGGVTERTEVWVRREEGKGKSGERLVKEVSMWLGPMS